MGSRRSLPPWVTIAMFGVVAVVLLGSAIWQAGISAQLCAKGEVTAATCTRVERGSQRRGGKRRTRTIWHVAFTTQDGRPQSTTIDAGFSGLKAGEEVEVLYNPKSPQQALMNTFVGLWGVPIFLTMIAAVLLWLLQSFRKKSRPSVDSA